MFYHRYVLITNRLPVCEHFAADIITQVITSPKRIHSFVSTFPANFENSAFTPIQLLFGLVFESSSKIFGMQLTCVHVAKDVAK